MRRYITLLLVLLLALSLAGCGGYTKEDLNKARRESHQAGYEMGYKAGLRDAEDDYSEGYAKGYDAARSLYTTPIESNYVPESYYSDYDSIFTYGTDADSILDYIRDNPHEFNLYTEGDVCDAHEAGANGEDWFVR